MEIIQKNLKFENLKEIFTSLKENNTKKGERKWNFQAATMLNVDRHF